MADPLTIGAMAAWALGAAAEAIGKGLLGEAAKDAYKTLKEKIGRWAGSDVETLEKAPTSTNRRGIIAEIIDQLSKEDKESLRIAMEPLLEGLKENATKIGLDIGTLTNVQTHLRTLNVTEGIGARIKEASGGILEVDEI